MDWYPTGSSEITEAVRSYSKVYPDEFQCVSTDILRVRLVLTVIISASFVPQNIPDGYTQV